MTAFLHGFVNFTRIGCASKWNHTSPFEKCHNQSAQNSGEHLFNFLKIWDIWIPIFRFVIPSYCQVNVFLGLVEIGHVSRFTDLFTNLKMLTNLFLILFVSWWYIPCGQFGPIPFPKWCTKLGKYKKQAKPKKSYFVCIVLPIVLPIHSAWNH